METRESLVKTRIGYGPSARSVSVQPIRKLADTSTPHRSEPPSPANPELDQTSAAKDRSRKLRGKAVVLGLLGLVTCVLYYWHASGLEATDDAQVDAHISSVSSRVVGTVRAVHVNAHDAVRAGQLLLELDPTDFQIAVDAAHANVARAEAALNVEQPALAITETGDASTLASTRSELKSAQAALAGAARETKQLRAQLAQADAQSSLATSERDRAVALSQRGALSPAELETRVRFADANRAGANALREQIAASAARTSQREAEISAIQSRIQELQSNSPRRLASRRAALEVARANSQVAKAELAQAEAQLSYTKIYAPAAGIVGAKVVRPGEAIAAGQTLLALCPIDDPWITANFRETQLRNMRPGQHASIYVDALARTFEGRVESIAGATGSRFSLFPPENASGNFVKVVQRVPVKILLDPQQAGLSLLRAGMSVEPSVRTQ